MKIKLSYADFLREAIWHAEDLDNALDIWPRTLARHIEE